MVERCKAEWEGGNVSWGREAGRPRPYGLGRMPMPWIRRKGGRGAQDNDRSSGQPRSSWVERSRRTCSAGDGPLDYAPLRLRLHFARKATERATIKKALASRQSLLIVSTANQYLTGQVHNPPGRKRGSWESGEISRHQAGPPKSLCTWKETRTYD